jgi:exopolysaccharide production protein ExoQ
VLLPLSILLIKYYPDLGRGYAQHWAGTQFFTGVSDNKNMLGMVCMVFGFTAAWRVLQAWSGSHRGRRTTLIVHGTLLTMAIWLLVTCDSKTSLVCFVATSGLIAAHSVFKAARKHAAVHAMVGLIALSSYAVLFLHLGGVLETMGRDSTLTGRTAIWEGLLRVPINPLVGTGFESFWLGDRLEKLWTLNEFSNITEAHNGYLEVYLNLGAVGLVLLSTLMVTAYRNVLRLLDSDPRSGRLRLGFFVIAVVYNFTEAGIRSTDLVWIAFLLVAIRVVLKAEVPVPMARPSAAAFGHADSSIEALSPSTSQA